LEYKREKSLKEEEQMITAFPDVTTYKIKSDDLFIVMGCDGIWETMNEDQIGDFFRKNLNESTPISTTVGQFLDASLATDTTSTLLF
jgi:serine/threonine protein phosphatase PrpC